MGRRILAAAAVALVPWLVWLALTLPHTETARHWDVVWTGLDGAIAVGLGVTARLGGTGTRLATGVATATATLMGTDAWFDVCTSTEPGFAVACAAVEVPLAVLCLAVGVRARPDGPDGPDRAPFGPCRVRRPRPRWSP
jgi:hypothetical protein